MAQMGGGGGVALVASTKINNLNKNGGALKCHDQ